MSTVGAKKAVSALFGFIFSFLALFATGNYMKVDATIYFLISIGAALAFMTLAYYSPWSLIGIPVFLLVAGVSILTGLPAAWLFGASVLLGLILAAVIGSILRWESPL